MIIALIALAAAAPAPIYDAWGTEPFWGLTITRKTMVVDDQSAERKISAPTPQPKVTRLGMTYAAPGMTVIIRHEGCNDGMSEGVQADTVEVKLKDYSFHGCGGPDVLPRHIAGSSWDIYSVNGETIPYVPEEDPRHRSDLFAIHWQLNRTVHANFGCGLLIGRYRAGGGRITPTAKLAREAGGTCPHEAYERKVLAILAAPAPVVWMEDDEEIELKNRAGTLHLRRRY